MYFDLNIPYKDLNSIESVLARIQSFQNATIALNVTTDEPLTSKAVQSIQPVAPERFQNIRQLKRVTVLVDDPRKNYQLVSSNIAANQTIDILAVRPTTPDASKAACQNYDVDIISIDCFTKRLIPNHTTAQVALQRGVFFEICYAPVYRTQQGRHNFFANIRRLIEVTRGNNIIFSSEALQAMEIRRTNDIKMLGQLLGMTHIQVEAAVSQSFQRLLLKAETRQSTLHAAIRIDLIVPEPEDEFKKRKLEEQDQYSKQTQKKKKNKKNTQQ